MNPVQGKSALNARRPAWSCGQQGAPALIALCPARLCKHSHRPPINRRRSPHSSTNSTFLPHSLLYCPVARLAPFCCLSIYCYTLWGPVVHSRTPPLPATRSRSLVPRLFHALLFWRASVVGGCTLSVPVPRPVQQTSVLAATDWLTRAISSAPTPSAIGSGEPLLFGAGLLP
jgi:hypothetical protein